MNDLTIKQEYYKAIISTKGMMSVKDISILLNKDRTTIQKVLKSLYINDHITRKQVNCNRGFKYVYFVNEV